MFLNVCGGLSVFVYPGISIFFTSVCAWCHVINERLNNEKKVPIFESWHSGHGFHIMTIQGDSAFHSSRVVSLRLGRYSDSYSSLASRINITLADDASECFYIRCHVKALYLILIAFHLQMLVQVGLIMGAPFVPFVGATVDISVDWRDMQPAALATHQRCSPSWLMFCCQHSSRHVINRPMRTMLTMLGRLPVAGAGMPGMMK